MASVVYPAVMLGRVELAAADCCGALFMDLKDAEKHEGDHLSTRISLKLLERFARNV